MDTGSFFITTLGFILPVVFELVLVELVFALVGLLLDVFCLLPVPAPLTKVTVFLTEVSPVVVAGVVFAVLVVTVFVFLMSPILL